MRYHDAMPQHPWLPILRAMHAVIDAGVAAAVRGRKVACRQGCTVCCRTQSDIAVFPLELAGISWYCTERLERRVRDAVRTQLAAHLRGGACPFLVAGSCAVYEVRPMACRQFTVFGKPCTEGEDPWHTRRRDMLLPRRELLEKAYRIMLPFHGVAAREDQDQWLARGHIETLARNLAALDWRGLVRLMDAHDARRGGSASSA